MAQLTNTVAKKIFLTKTGKSMFIWVTVCSIISSVAVVVSIALTQRIFFINKVIDEKNKTINDLKLNNSEIPKLQDSVRALNSNQNLIDSKARESDEPVQVVLDALPSELNTAALGSYLDELRSKYSNGVDVSNIGIGPSDYTSTSSSLNSTKVAGAYEIPVTFNLEGSQENVINFLTNLERSVRAIDIRTISSLISPKEGVSNNIKVDLSGVVYYQPAKTIKVEEKALSR